MRSLKRQFRGVIRRKLNQRGYYHVPSLLSPSLKWQPNSLDEFHRNANEVMARHRLQDKHTVAALREKYQRPLLGEIRVSRLLELLAQCIDPSSVYLYCTSQLTHALQIVEAMEKNGVRDKDMLIMGFLHDLGKISYLTGEIVENVDGGGKRPIGHNEHGAGLDNCNLTWDHGDIIYTRMKPYVPEHIAWLLHYHSMDPSCFPLMDARDRSYFEKYYKQFYAFDATNVFYYLPSVQLSGYIGLIDEFFPDPIVF